MAEFDANPPANPKPAVVEPVDGCGGADAVNENPGETVESLEPAGLVSAEDLDVELNCATFSWRSVGFEANDGVLFAVEDADLEAAVAKSLASDDVAEAGLDCKAGNDEEANLFVAMPVSVDFAVPEAAVPV